MMRISSMVNELTCRKNTLTMLLMLLSLSLGCGQGDYEEAMVRRAQKLDLGTGFLENLHVKTEDILGGIASLQLPKYIDNQAKVLKKGQKSRIGNPLGIGRIQPPGMDIPGFDFTYEMFQTLEGIANEQAVYWSFGSVPSDMSLKQLEAKMKADVGKAVPNTRASFVDAALATPTGGSIPFRRLTARGKQVFTAGRATDDTEEFPGELRVYIHSAGERHLIFVLRGTDQVIQRLDAMNVAELALGTLTTG